MACFLVTTAEAIVTTVVAKVLEKREEKIEVNGKKSEKATESVTNVRFSDKLKWLRNLLWGGSGLLAFEHVWHGEVTPWPPFLTAASNPADTAEMFHEMSTVGVAMACAVNLVWIGMLGVSSLMSKRAQDALTNER